MAGAGAGLSSGAVHEQCDGGKNLYGAGGIDHLQDRDVSTAKLERNTLRRTLGSEWGDVSCKMSNSICLYVITQTGLYKKGIAYVSPNPKSLRSKVR